MSSEATPDITPESKIIGYCRVCGKALDESTVYSAQGTIFCQEHVPATPSVEPPPYAAPAYTASPYTSPTPPAIPNADVSPGLAFLLGLIPGVGAIYNGQYAKGLTHVFVLGLMFTIVGEDMAGGLEPMVGLLIAAFWAYMPFEAYHTAQKRRAGQPVDEFSGLARNGMSRFPVAPVVLITLGALFLANNLGWLRIRDLVRYWPVLMIALGVYLLWSRMTGNGSQGPDNPGGQA